MRYYRHIVHDKSSLFASIAKVVIILGVFFSIHLSILPSAFNARHIGITVLAVMFFCEWFKNGFKIRLSAINTIEVKWFISTFVVLLYTVVITFANGYSLNDSYTYTSKVVNYFTMLTVLAYMMKYVFIGTEDFCRVFVIAATIEALLVLSTVIYSPMRNVILSIQDMSFFDDFDHKYGWRIIGLGIAGAGGSIYLYCGLIANAFYLLFKKQSYLYVVTYIIIYVALSLVARTGFYLASILTVYCLLVKSRNGTKKLRMLIFVLISIILLAVVFLFMEPVLGNLDSRLLTYTIGRIDALFGDSNALDRVAETYVSTPPISFKTLIGSGVYRGTAKNGLYFWNDSGYAKRYAAIGLIMTVFSYVALLVYICKKMKNVDCSIKRFVWMILILMYIAEYKEHFMFMYSYPTIIIMLLHMQEKDLRRLQLYKM